MEWAIINTQGKKWDLRGYWSCLAMGLVQSLKAKQLEWKVNVTVHSNVTETSLGQRNG